MVIISPLSFLQQPVKSQPSWRGYYVLLALHHSLVYVDRILPCPVQQGMFVYLLLLTSTSNTCSLHLLVGVGVSDFHFVLSSALLSSY